MVNKLSDKKQNKKNRFSLRGLNKVENTGFSKKLEVFLIWSTELKINFK